MSREKQWQFPKEMLWFCLRRGLSGLSLLWEGPHGELQGEKQRKNRREMGCKGRTRWAAGGGGRNLERAREKVKDIKIKEKGMSAKAFTNPFSGRSARPLDSSECTVSGSLLPSSPPPHPPHTASLLPAYVSVCRTHPEWQTQELSYSLKEKNLSPTLSKATDA